MKTKIKILLVSCVIAAAAVTGFNMAQENSNMDVSLADITVMATADGESGNGNCGGALGAYTWQPASIFGGNQEFNRCSLGCPIQKGRNPQFQQC